MERAIEPESEAPAVKALGSLFKLTKVFLWDNADGTRSDGILAKTDCCPLLEDGELVEQMSALGLPLSFQTNKERSGMFGGKRKGMKKKQLPDHEGSVDSPLDLVEVSKVEVKSTTAFHYETSDYLCCSSMLGQSELPYCGIAMDINKTPCLTGKEEDLAYLSARSSCAAVEEQLCDGVSGIRSDYSLVCGTEHDSVVSMEDMKTAGPCNSATQTSPGSIMVNEYDKEDDLPYLSARSSCAAVEEPLCDGVSGIMSNYSLVCGTEHDSVVSMEDMKTAGPCNSATQTSPGSIMVNEYGKEDDLAYLSARSSCAAAVEEPLCDAVSGIMSNYSLVCGTEHDSVVSMEDMKTAGPCNSAAQTSPGSIMVNEYGKEEDLPYLSARSSCAAVEEQLCDGDYSLVCGTEHDNVVSREDMKTASPCNSAAQTAPGSIMVNEDIDHHKREHDGGSIEVACVEGSLLVDGDSGGKKCFSDSCIEQAQGADVIAYSQSSEVIDHDGNDSKHNGAFGDWTSYWDSFYTRYYFYNIKTLESTWDPPVGMEHLVYREVKEKSGEMITETAEMNFHPAVYLDHGKPLDYCGFQCDSYSFGVSKNGDKSLDQPPCEASDGFELAGDNFLDLMTPPALNDGSEQLNEIQRIDRRGSIDLLRTYVYSTEKPECCGRPGNSDNITSFDGIPAKCPDEDAFQPSNATSGALIRALSEGSGDDSMPLGTMDPATDKLETKHNFGIRKMGKNARKRFRLNMNLSCDNGGNISGGASSGRGGSGRGRGTLFCTHCRGTNHTVDYCYDLRGYSQAHQVAHSEVTGHFTHSSADSRVTISAEEYQQYQRLMSIQPSAETSSSTATLAQTGLPFQGIFQEFSPLIKKYWWQRYRLFSRFDEGIKMDEEGWFSVTPESVARHHALRCGTGIIIDCFTGVGGNAIQFAQRSNHVIAIDIDSNKIDYAQHNATIYGVEDRIDFVRGDTFLLAPKLKADTVFLSPPWGGPEYAKVTTYDMNTMLKPHDGHMLFNVARGIASKVVIFLPRNVDLNQLAELALSANPPWLLEVEKNYLNGKLKAVTAYFTDTSK